MPKEELELIFSQISKQLSDISADTKEIKRDIQQHTIDMVGIKKDIERIDKERDEDKIKQEKDITIVHDSLRSRDKKQMWLTTIMVGIGGTIATIASFFINKG